MIYTVEGKIKDIWEIKGTSKSGNEWVAKKVLLEVDDADNWQGNPKNLQLDIFGQESIDLNPCHVGQNVVCDFKVESRNGNGPHMWFTTCQVWRLWDAKEVSDRVDKTSPKVERPF